jgi:hypothetical protein
VVRDERARRVVPLVAALLLALSALALPSAGGGTAAATKAETAVASVAAPLLRPGPAPRTDDAVGKPLPAAAPPPATAYGTPALGRSAVPGGHGTAVLRGRFLRYGRAPPYALV